MMSHKLELWLVLTIVVLAFCLRLFYLTTPLADWHSFRQADTASVAREYFNNGVNLLSPKYHDLSNIQSGKDNPRGFRMVEFPLISALVAWSYPPIRALSSWPIHVWYRFTSVLFSLGSLLTLYFLLKALFSTRAALLSSLFFAVIPYNIFYNRSIFPENALVFFCLLTLLVSVKIKAKSHWWYFLLMGLSGAIALLLKPMAGFMLLPLIVSAFYAIRKAPKTLISWILTLLVMVIPLLLWRRWITQFPEGIPASSWLYNGNGIRLRPAWFRWLFYERLTKLILGFSLVPLLITGLYSLFRLPKISTDRRFSIFFTLTWFIGILAYLIIFATGNVQHDYYQIMTIPPICLLLGLGVDYLFQLNRKFINVAIFILTASGLLLAWNLVSGYYHINHWAIVRAGEAVDRLIPKDALIIAPYMGDTAFLYQTNRHGWPLGFDLNKKIAAGAKYYVSVNYDDETNELLAKYPVIFQNPDFVILKLSPSQFAPSP